MYSILEKGENYAYLKGDVHIDSQKPYRSFAKILSSDLSRLMQYFTPWKGYDSYKCPLYFQLK